MVRYLLIESRSPFESHDVAYMYTMARELIDYGHEVTLFLVQNGVLAARKNAKVAGLEDMPDDVTVLVDDLSLDERAIPHDGLRTNVRVSSLDLVVDMMAGGAKVVWH